MTKSALDRIVFTTSRLAEFCSEKELVNKTGHDSDDWPLVVLKELTDNALDACEEAGTAPVIHVSGFGCRDRRLGQRAGDRARDGRGHPRL